MRLATPTFLSCFCRIFLFLKKDLTFGIFYIYYASFSWKRMIMTRKNILPTLHGVIICFLCVICEGTKRTSTRKWSTEGGAATPSSLLSSFDESFLLSIFQEKNHKNNPEKCNNRYKKCKNSFSRFMVQWGLHPEPHAKNAPKNGEHPQVFFANSPTFSNGLDFVGPHHAICKNIDNNQKNPQHISNFLW